MRGYITNGAHHVGATKNTGAYRELTNCKKNVNKKKKNLSYNADQGTQGRGQCNGPGVYCDLSTASEVFLIFTTQLCQYFSVFFSICYLVTSLNYSFLNILPNSNTSCSSLSVGSNK